VALPPALLTPNNRNQGKMQGVMARWFGR